MVEARDPLQYIESNKYEYVKVFLERGHRPSLDEDGRIIKFIYDEPGHNGPGCEVCGFSQCWHCDWRGNYIPKCNGAVC